jgi:hypothetical protein
MPNPRLFGPPVRSPRGDGAATHLLAPFLLWETPKESMGLIAENRGSVQVEHANVWISRFFRFCRMTPN